MLKLQSVWRFNSPGSIAVEVINEFDDLVHKVARQGQQWGMLEHFGRKPTSQGPPASLPAPARVRVGLHLTSIII